LARRRRAQGPESGKGPGGPMPARPGLSLSDGSYCAFLADADTVRRAHMPAGSCPGTAQMM
jgi:hypothetical protein